MWWDNVAIPLRLLLKPHEKVGDWQSNCGEAAY